MFTDTRFHPAPGVHRIALPIVNAYILGDKTNWLLVDAGLPGSVKTILETVEHLGLAQPPRGIVLTHAHFDHVGALKALLKEWDTPVYAHRLELPYLTGKADYEKPNAHAGGLMSALSPLYPRRAMNLGERVRALPEDGSLPGFLEWHWLHTPGHTVGHVNLWRGSDGTLIAGDAVTTTRQESALSALLKFPHVYGPPPYFTPDWITARASVRLIAKLEPELLLTGHGWPLRGSSMRRQLEQLVEEFERIAVPENRRVQTPGVATTG
jgi:glyoxylase-like metal-dependent hydrolase (beta-lactamase superfamily II)